MDVCYYAKIRILKQITTIIQGQIYSFRMFVTYAKIRILKQITTAN